MLVNRNPFAGADFRGIVLWAGIDAKGLSPVSERRFDTQGRIRSPACPVYDADPVMVELPFDHPSKAAFNLERVPKASGEFGSGAEFGVIQSGVLWDAVFLSDTEGASVNRASEKEVPILIERVPDARAGRSQQEKPVLTESPGQAYSRQDRILRRG